MYAARHRVDPRPVLPRRLGTGLGEEERAQDPGCACRVLRARPTVRAQEMNDPPPGPGLGSQLADQPVNVVRLVQTNAEAVGAERLESIARLDTEHPAAPLL